MPRDVDVWVCPDCGLLEELCECDFQEEEEDLASLCSDCGKHAFEACSLCGLPLCPMCHECSGGVCNQH